jgi:hypothetical protein
VDIKSFSSFVRKKKSFSSYLQILDSDRRNTHAILLPCFFFVTDIEVLPCDSERGLKSHLKHASN